MRTFSNASFPITRVGYSSHMTWTRVRLESLISRLVTRLDKQLIRLGLDLELNTKDLWIDLDLSPSNRKRLDYLAQVRDLKVPYYRYHCSDLTSAPVNATSWQPIPQSTPHSFCPSNHLFHHNPAQYNSWPATIPTTALSQDCQNAKTYLVLMRRLLLSSAAFMLAIALASAAPYSVSW